MSPTGKRSYRAATAARHASKSTRWATKLAAGNVDHAERGHVHGVQGGTSWFIDADWFERAGRSRGWWPPPAAGGPLSPNSATTNPASEAGTEWEQLVALQGADLEALRTRCKSLESVVERLTQERNQLLDVITSLAASAKR